VDSRLAAINQNRHAARPCTRTKRRHVHDGAQNIGAVRDGDQPGPRRDRLEHLYRVQRARAVHIDPFDHHAVAFAQEMPWYDVGVVLHDAENDLIACLHAGHGPAIGDHVDAFGRTRVEDDLILAGRAQKPRNDTTHAFVIVGRQIGKVMQTAMHIGVFLRIGG